MINEFTGDYRWLSNFTPVKIELECIEYPSVEAAYMSAKCHDKEWKDVCKDPKNSAGTIKRLSKKVKLREDWEQVKLDVMKVCLREKFTQEPFLSNLLETGTEFIQEGNWWKDKYWGVCLQTGKGENHLGKLIMIIRKSLILDKN